MDDGWCDIKNSSAANQRSIEKRASSDGDWSLCRKDGQGFPAAAQGDYGESAWVE